MRDGDDGGPAFPCTFGPETRSLEVNAFPGMSLRDLFAAHALAAIIQANGIPYAGHPKWQALHAKYAYGHADAMLESRALSLVAVGGGV